MSLQRLRSQTNDFPLQTSPWSFSTHRSTTPLSLPSPLWLYGNEKLSAKGLNCTSLSLRGDQGHLRMSLEVLSMSESQVDLSSNEDSAVMPGFRDAPTCQDPAKGSLRLNGRNQSILSQRSGKSQSVECQCLFY